jgi:photosystem II stability/assembly factor-like uncharacterized protein/tetratricopeptide (TPR) repeat protein
MRMLFASPTLLLMVLGTSARAADLRYFEDAALRAVHFADDREGWVVGDEGVVWHTLDGGKSWERQATGTRASLRSVFFLPKNPFVGWVVGREELPHGQGSVGVMLFTANGGGTWQRLLVNAMPGLNKVRFTDSKIGYVFGDGSDQFPTGVFKTKDGGRTWEPVPGQRLPSWLAGDFLTGQTGILAGAWGRLATFRLDAFHAAEIEGVGGRSVHGVFVFNHCALAVGEGGLMLTSRTQGAKWGFANERLKLADDVLANLDFRAVHGAGDHAWVVGRPGSIVLHSPDLGDNWQVYKTGHSLPLNAVFFLDEKRGWAVGELGSILGSADGGKSWQVQRQGGKRAALLAVHARPGDVPVDTLARIGAEDGYLVSTLRVAAPDPASAAPSQATAGQRLALAARQAGGASGEMLWQFPLPQHLAGADKRALLEYWNQLHGTEAEKQLLRQLVLALRTWRPDVVITDHPDARKTDNVAGALVAEAMHEAVKLAADAKAFPEQTGTLGLAPWRVTRLYTAWDQRSGSQAVVDGSEARPLLEASAADYAAVPASLLADGPRSLPRQRFYRLVDGTDVGAKQSYLMAGVAPGNEARRRLPAGPKPDPEAIKPYLARRNLETLAANLSDPGKTLAQIGPLLAGLPEDQGAAAALAIGNLYARQGQWPLARETFLLMVDRYPAHPLSAEAYRWLIRHISSSEARRRHDLQQFFMVQKATIFDRWPEKKERLPETKVIRQAGLTYLSDKMEARQWYRGSLEFGKRLAGYGPLFASDPSTQFCLQASRRNLGEFEEALGTYQKFRTHFSKGPWHDAAAAELWLATSRQGQPPKPVALCRPAEARPILDGKLDDACWQGKPLVLVDAVNKTGEPYRTEAWFAYDQDYLYVALRCKHPAGQRVPPVKKRKHDDDLRRFDRVSIMLDLDRDYSTYFHLQIDQRGCLHEDCWGDAGWDPRWFVAVDSTDDCWQIEAAVPLTELTADRIRGGTAWAVNVVRILPGRGVQAFSLPADLEPRPEGMGLLLFDAIK